MTMTEAAENKAKAKGHDEIFAKQLGGNSGRYYWQCCACGEQINYYEGEWFGGVLETDCKRKQVVASNKQ